MLCAALFYINLNIRTCFCYFYLISTQVNEFVFLPSFTLMSGTASIPCFSELGDVSTRKVNKFEHCSFLAGLFISLMSSLILMSSLMHFDEENILLVAVVTVTYNSL